MITWSSEPEHKAAGIALSNGDLTAERSGGTSWQAVRSTISKSSGKWYWEVKVNVANSAHTMIGIGTSSETLTYPGDTLEGYSYYGSVGYIYHDASTLWGTGYTANDVIGIALDLDNGKIWWSKNGDWQESGDPAAGTNEAYSGIAGTFFAMIGLFTNGNKSTVNFGATAFQDSVPDGFEPFELLPVVTFGFTNPIPAHLSTVYGTSHTLQLTVTCSGEDPSYIYDAKFYDAFDDSQIGSTVSGMNSEQSVSTTMQTPSGINYNWYLWATSSGESDTSSTYTFTNKFLCVGTVKEGETPLAGIPVRLYKRDTGELVGVTTSTGVSGTFEIVTDYNEYHYAIALYASTVSGVDITETNALIYDHLKP